MKWVRAFCLGMFAFGAFVIVTRDPDAVVGGQPYLDAMDRSKLAVSTDQIPCVDGDLRVDWPANVTRRCDGNRWSRLPWEETRLIVLAGRALPYYAVPIADAELDSQGPEVGGALKMSIYKAASGWKVSGNGSLFIAVRKERIPTEGELIKFSKRRYSGKRMFLKGVVYSQGRDFVFADGPTFSLGVTGDQATKIAQEISDIFSAN